MKKTIEISTRGTHLSLRESRLAIKQDKEIVSHIPIEDIGLLVLDSTGISLSSGVLKALADSGGSLLACDDSHTPAGIFLPLAGNTLAGERLRHQVAASKPLHKNAWALVIKSKIRNQARVINDPDDAGFLRKLADDVKSGDAGQREARAAQYYWPRVFTGAVLPDGSKFRRARDGAPPNSLLNYGYAVLRAATARSICSAGLQPGLGIHHSNRYNSFGLADDLMEPYRPFVDRIVQRLSRSGMLELTKATKQELLAVLGTPVLMGKEQTVLDIALETTASSLARCFELQVKDGKSAPEAARALKLPVFPGRQSCQ